MGAILARPTTISGRREVLKALESRKISADRVLAHYGKSSTLGVGQSKTLSSELVPENAVLFTKIVDRGVLLVGDLADHRGDQDLPEMEDRCHS
jgi:hypothetical protein